MRRSRSLFITLLLALACVLPDLVPTMTPDPGATAATLPLPRPPETTAYGGDQLLVILVDPALVSGIRAGLDTFEADLCLDGYAVVERLADFTDPPEVRDYLAQQYRDSGGSMSGALLIGDIPYAYQQVVQAFANPSLPTLVEEVISLQYYTDLDGIFRASPGYVSPGRHAFSFDVHEADVDWEIWVGLLPRYRGDASLTVEALDRYFEKNHAYRGGRYDIPRGYLEVNEHYHPASAAEDTSFLDEMAYGQYAWTPLSSAASARLYFDSFSGTLTVDQGYADLAAGAADIAVLAAHGNPLSSGRIDTAWIERNGLQTTLLWSDGCAVGDLDQPGNFLSTALYSPASRVLIAKGTTNDSGGLGTNSDGSYGHNIAAGIAAGMSLGRAVLSHVNTALIAPWSEAREFHYASVVLLGDPTLRLRP